MTLPDGPTASVRADPVIKSFRDEIVALDVACSGS